MATKSRYSKYAKAIYGEQATASALSIRDKLSLMKEKAKAVNKKPEKAGKEGE
ncbi:MAG: hypothetical protein IJU77_14370 [Butyrivibrio sp.]|nr:hypothetical protein [Butyrivibrio sp.]